MNTSPKLEDNIWFCQDGTGMMYFICSIQIIVVRYNYTAKP